jgi:hypothetical protein
MDRIDLYLRAQIGEQYENTKKENAMVQKVSALLSIAEEYKNGISYANPQNLEMWRKAYLGTLNAIDISTGKESKRRSRQLRKMIYELIESKVDNSIPMPRMTPRGRNDLDLVDVT